MFFGHDDKISLFKKLAKSDGFRHAYLFFGDSQIGKSLFTKHLAYFLEYGEFSAGGACSSVRRESALGGDFSAGDLKPFLDALFILPNENNVIGIGEVSRIKNFLWQTPLNSSKRLLVIDQSEALTKEAQSGLLKIVEEPPPHSLIIFIAHDPQILFPPLLSRLSKVYFRRLSEKNMQIFLELLGSSEREVREIARKSFGRAGRAIELKEGKIKKNEGFLESEIGEIILDLWTRDRYQSSRKLAWLLDREVALKRYNLNQNLQRKAVNQVI